MAITLDGTVGVTSPDFIPSSSNIPTNGLFLPAANTVGLATGSTERLRIDSSGNLGLGVTPSAWGSGFKALQVGARGSVYAGSDASMRLAYNAYYDGTSFKRIAASSASQWLADIDGSFAWFQAGSSTAGSAISFTQAMTLDASGNLLVGTTSPSGKLAVYGPNVATNSNGLINVTSTDAAAIDLGGSIGFGGSYTGTSTTPWATISGRKENATDGNYASYLQFATRYQGGGITERARIDSSGNLLVGTTTAPTQGKMNVVNGFQMTGASTGTAISSNNGSAEVAYLTLGASYNVAGSYDVALGITNIATTAGKRIIIQNRTAGVYVADGGTSWTSNSDERLKTDLKPIENAAQKVSTLRAVTGRYIVDEEGVSRSFLIAQDVHAVLPEAVDASDPDKLGVAYTETIPLLVAAIKELTARLEALEAK